MNDIIEQAREEQAKLATQFAGVLHKHLAPKFNAELDRAIRAAAAQGMQVNLTLAAEMFREELERDVFVSLIGIADWLGSRVVRDHLHNDSQPRKVQVTLDKKHLPSIAEKYHVDQATLALVLQHLLEKEVTLAPIGKLVDGYLQPNWDSLKKWADAYDWSPEPR